MSSETVGVQGLIQKDAPKAVYTHCSGHCLILVMCNTLNRMKATVMFFTNSPKTDCLLVEVATKGRHPTGLRKPLIELALL